MKYITIAMCLFLSLTPTTIIAAGIQVSPARLEITSGREAEMIVANPTAEMQLCEISADDFEQFLDILPKSFTLEAGGRKTIKVSVDPQGSHSPAGSVLGTSLSIITRPLAKQGLPVGTGVKLPMTINITNANRPKNYWFVVGLPVLALAGIASGLILVKKRRQKLTT